MIRRLSLIVLIALGITGCCRAQSNTDDHSEFGTGSERCQFRQLEEQGFSGGLGRGTVIDFLGIVSTTERSYATYYYEFNNPESMHGNHRLIVLDRNCNYLGSYTLNGRPLFAYGNKVIFPDIGSGGNVVEFKGKTIPDHIWIHGDWVKPGR